MVDVSCHTSGVQDFEFVPGFLENFGTPLLGFVKYGTIIGDCVK
jgi:hypothetical protein